MYRKRLPHDDQTRPASFHELLKYVDEIPCSPPDRPGLAGNYRIIAIGDIHADFDALFTILQTAEVIDHQGEWIGGNTVVVQTGDLVDGRRPGSGIESSNPDFDPEPYDELVIFDFLANLAHQADREGGKVVICIGNHEYMNMVTEKFPTWRDYVSDKVARQFGKYREALFYPGQPLARKLACLTRLYYLDGNWIFMHGGLHPTVFTNLETLRWYEQLFKQLMVDGDMSLNAYMNGYWLFFDRTFGRKRVSESSCKEYLRSAIQLGLPDLKMVIGHTAQEYPNVVCTNPVGEPAVFRIDTRISRAFGPKHNPNDRLYFLEIIRQTHGRDQVYYVDCRNPGTKIPVPTL